MASNRADKRGHWPRGRPRNAVDPKRRRRSNSRPIRMASGSRSASAEGSSMRPGRDVPTPDDILKLAQTDVCVAKWIECWRFGGCSFEQALMGAVVHLAHGQTHGVSPVQYVLRNSFGYLDPHVDSCTCLTCGHKWRASREGGNECPRCGPGLANDYAASTRRCALRTSLRRWAYRQSLPRPTMTRAARCRQRSWRDVAASFAAIVGRRRSQRRNAPSAI
jgi:hypothetical protein